MLTRAISRTFVRVPLVPQLVDRPEEKVVANFGEYV